MELSHDKAIAELKYLGARWPDTLILFSWAGTLCVCSREEDGKMRVIEHIPGIPNDGGDPTDNEIVGPMTHTVYINNKWYKTLGYLHPDCRKPYFEKKTDYPPGEHAIDCPDCCQFNDWPQPFKRTPPFTDTHKER